ncbi:MAG: RNA pseudouridine synthase, partial [Lachnospiraceae bacterium]|nr:RNA pseudouridine synthase [Lachnospiraceae bacterium]
MGVLSQKAAKGDMSLNEWLIGYLLQNGAMTMADLAVYKPSVCNRLDRNTSGIVLCAKSLKGAQLLSELLKNRTLHKYYQLYVKGRISEEHLVDGFLMKDEKRNKVSVVPSDTNGAKQSKKLAGEPQGSYIRTAYKPLKAEEDKTLLEVELFTGKTHQIRAHLASIGHPLLGDYK